jgi:hypothetical protein
MGRAEGGENLRRRSHTRCFAISDTWPRTLAPANPTREMARSAGCPAAQASVPKVTVGSFRSCECRGHGGWEIRVRRKSMYRTGAVRKTMTLACALALTGVGAYLPFFTLLGGAAAWPMITKDTALERLGRRTIFFHASAFTVRAPPPAQPTVFVTAVAVKPFQLTSDQWA